MAPPNMKFKEFSIVLLGNFNPVIFSPWWLAKKGIITENDAEESEIKICHADLAEFTTNGCFFQIFINKFTVTTKQEFSLDLMFDNTISIFSNLLETPIKQLGLNLTCHYKFDDKDSYVNFGHKLVPKEDLWKNLLGESGLRGITVEEYINEDAQAEILSKKGRKGVSVGISNAKEVSPYGIYIQVNNHFDFDLKNQNKSLDAKMAIDTINSQRKTAFKTSENLIEGLYEHCTKN